MTTSYVFIDSDNGGTPANATPDTATSKYHTSDPGWPTNPANGARWSDLNAALTDATIQALTNDLYVKWIGSADLTTVVSGLSTLSCSSLTIEGNASSAAWDAAKATLSYTGATANAISLGYTGPITLKNFQVSNTGSNTTPRAIAHTAASGSPLITINGVKVRIGGSGTGTGVGITRTGASTPDFIIVNCVVQQTGTPGGRRDGIIANTGTVLLYNNVVEGFNGTSAVGITTKVGATVKNCASFNNTDDFSSGTMAYCASDDGDGTNAQTSVTWANEFTDYANGDFTLKAGGTKLQGTGIGPGSDANVPTLDINGDTRSGATTDIGADLYAAGSSLTDVDTDETITTGQTSVAYTGTGLTNADGLVITTDTSVNVSATSFSATNATSGTFTAPTLAASLTAGVKFGACTFDIQDGGVSLGTLAGTFNAESAYTVHTVTDTSQAADPGCIYYWINAAGTDVASGDQIIFDNQSGNVTMDSQGYLAFAGGVTQTTYRARDDTDNTWASGWSTINVNDIVVTDSLGSSFHNTFISTF